LIKFLFLVGFVLVGVTGVSQTPEADFSGTPLSGCAPLAVTFKDLSKGNPKFWNWDFGNGQLSNIQNPTAYFNTPGKYSITLVVRNSDGTDGITKKDYIVVNTSPTASFAANTNIACVPAVIQFTDQSTGNLVKWQWDFGDGTSSTARNPQKVYTKTGFYTVTLVVTSNTGCQSTYSAARYIRVVSGVKAEFIDSIQSVCKPPFNAEFLNQTSGPGALS
jgi:PKD repeat protein